MPQGRLFEKWANEAKTTLPSNHPDARWRIRLGILYVDYHALRTELERLRDLVGDVDVEIINRVLGEDNA